MNHRWGRSWTRVACSGVMTAGQQVATADLREAWREALMAALAVEATPAELRN